MSLSSLQALPTPICHSFSYLPKARDRMRTNCLFPGSARNNNPLGLSDKISQVITMLQLKQQVSCALITNFDLYSYLLIRPVTSYLHEKKYLFYQIQRYSIFKVSKNIGKCSGKSSFDSLKLDFPRILTREFSN